MAKGSGGKRRVRALQHLAYRLTYATACYTIIDITVMLAHQAAQATKSQEVVIMSGWFLGLTLEDYKGQQTQVRYCLGDAGLTPAVQFPDILGAAAAVRGALAKVTDAAIVNEKITLDNDIVPSGDEALTGNAIISTEAVVSLMVDGDAYNKRQNVRIPAPAEAILETGKRGTGLAFDAADLEDFVDAVYNEVRFGQDGTLQAIDPTTDAGTPAGYWRTVARRRK